MLVVDGTERKKRSESSSHGLIDKMFSWSLDDIRNEELYKGEVHPIPESFESVEQYFGSYVVPLLEETRADVSSCMEIISGAPVAEVVSVVQTKTKSEVSLTYNVKVDSWKNRYRDGTKEPYRTLPGDFFVFTDFKPETDSDLQRDGRMYTFATVTKVMDDENEEEDTGKSYYENEVISTSTSFRVRTSKGIEVKDTMRTSLFVVFLMNTTTSTRIWSALHMFRNLNIIGNLLCSNSLGDGNCQLCSSQREHNWAENYDAQLLSALNESQSNSVLASICKLQCSHKSSVELIWGPPGTGKTKTVSTLLFTLREMDCRTLICAPTNVATVEIACRLLMLVNDRHGTGSKRNDLLAVGDILLFGNKDRLKIGSEIEEIYLDCRVKRLAECLGPLTGWRHCFTSMKDFFENCVSQYHIFIENESIKEAEGCNDKESVKEVDKSFLKFARDRYRSTAPSLQRCLSILCTHIAKSYISEHNYQNMVELIHLLDKFENLLFQNNLDSEELLELFSHADTFESSSHIFCIRSNSLSMLKALGQSLHELQLPSYMSSGSIADFCLRTASLIFSTSSSAFKLHSVGMPAFKLLVIDEAAQLKECESLIPLQLPGLSHVILIGDERQLPAMVKSNVSDEAGFGRSLFERLSALGHSKHLLNIQYRMHPKISCFPNSKFYRNQILDAENVTSRSYEKTYLPGPMFGPFSFINIFEGKEETDAGYSLKNLVEVAVIAKIVGNLHKAWDCSKEMLSVGVVSPYAAQVVAIQEKFGKKYEELDNFVVKVKSIDGFQGGEEDVVIISTVRANNRGAVGFIKDPRRTNVALTRARHCLWVLGSERTLANSESIWRKLVQDAKSRQCYFEADEDKDMAKSILQVKKEFDQLDDLLNGQSSLFRKARWKVLFSEDFKKSFGKLKVVRAKTSVINLLLRLASGWRPKRRNIDTVCECSSNLLKQFKVEGLYVICSNDIKKESSYMQVLKVWDILPLEDVPKLAKRLDNIFRKYTDNFINRCKEKLIGGGMEFPMSWPTSSEIVRFKDHSNPEPDTGITDDGSDGRSYIENSKVNESLLLMKFYSLSPCIVSHLLSDHGVKEMDLPFDVTDREMEIILYHASTFVLGRSGTGKTTVLTMKLFQNGQQHHIAMEGIEYGNADNSLDVYKEKIEDVQETRGAVLRQLFVTVSPKLAYAVKQHVSHLKSFAWGTKRSAEPSSTDVDYFDDTEKFNDIPDSFIHIPPRCYPLVITFHKFLMMLDGTLGTSYFARFPDVRGLCYEKTRSRSVAFQAFIQTREVNYDRFSCSYWPRLNTQLTKQLDPSKVFTEIISHIKGGLQADKSHQGKLSREDYVLLSDSRNSTLHRKKRDTIYDIFLQYEKLKLETGEFDVGDLVIDLHRRLRDENYVGDEMDFVYIDEVQDLTMRQISLFKYICRNVEDGFVFSGDTAQTIARGIDFRFEDIRSLFYKEFLLGSRYNVVEGKEEKGLISPIFHLNQNFRTHDGVLRLSQSVIDLLYHFFPSSIDILDPENSLIYGEAPVLLEPGNDENAIITIFGSSGNVGGSKSVIGFGAEQVILVRDDDAKKEISQYVGKQALILTIVECKGLEFQDVLLFNFFGSSPLKCQWRILYSYMEEQDLLSSPMSFPKFNEAKHNVLCSELKQLYVAITRTRQRLWICENLAEASKPMFEYWKKLGLAQVKKLDDSLARAMQVSSTPEEWKSRGMKLLAENNYEMATMCFERAGDFYWERLAKARGLKDTADRMNTSIPERARAVRREAAEIFEGIGEAEPAAKCYYLLDDFERAGNIYLKRCGESGLEMAGECFSKARLYKLAAEVYSRGNFFSKCLSVCTSGNCFDMGLQYIQHWKHNPTNIAMAEPSREMKKIEQDFLESCALHHHELKDKKAMMKFIRAFNSMESTRAFLKNLGCFEELLLLEEESGNFLIAAEIAQLRGDILLEADLLGKACHFKQASERILWHVFARSLWDQGNKGWPLKQFAQNEELLAKAKLFAKEESDFFYISVLNEATILSDERSSLFELKYFMIPKDKSRSITSGILSSRKVLDIHFHSNLSKYELSNELVADLRKHSEDKFSVNRISTDTLVYTWAFWQEKIENILRYLECLETEEVNHYAEYEDFCLNYLGLQKQCNNVNTIYALVYPNAYWVKEIDQRFLRTAGKSVTVDARHFVKGAQRYWRSEILSVGMKVLENLKFLYSFSVKNAVPMLAQSKLLINIFEVAKFLTKTHEVPKNNMISLQGHIRMSAENFFETAISPDRQNSPTMNMISLREMEVSCNMLQEVILLTINRNYRITYGQIGRVVMIILGCGKLKDELWGKIKNQFEGNAPWRDFIEQLCKCKVSLVPRGSAIWLMHNALENTYNANWILEPDYISPLCFLYLVERLLIWASSSHRRFFYTTKSSFVEWLICQEEHSIMNFSSLAGSTSTPPLESVHNFVCIVVEQLLYDKRTTSEWLNRSKLKSRDYYALLVLRLVVIMGLLSLESVNFRRKLFLLLGKSHISSEIPRQFSEALGKVKTNNSVTVLAEAFKKIDNPLVIVTLGTETSEFVSKDAVFVDLKVTRCKEDIVQLLFQDSTKASVDKIDDFRFGSKNSGSQANEPPKPDEDFKSLKDEGSSDLQKLCMQMSRIFNQFAVDYGKVSKKTARTIKMEVEKNIDVVSAALIRTVQTSTDCEAVNLVFEIDIMLSELKGIASALDVRESELEHTIPAIQERLRRLQSRRPKIETFLNQHLGLQNLSEPNADEASSEPNIASGRQQGERRDGLETVDESVNSDESECGTKPLHAVAAASSSGTQGKSNNSKQESNKGRSSKKSKKKGGKGGRKK